MNVLTIIPPLVQLNSPYPSGAYLTSFFKSNGHNAGWIDFSIELFYEIFSRNGLIRLFELTEQKALETADKAEENGDENTAFNIRRYIASKQSWCEWIEFITSVLSGGGAREKEHQFLYSPFAPRGQRMENFLESLGNEGREPSVDDVRFLCSYALADLADYITAVFDPEFSLVRYAEHLTVDERSFSEIEKTLDSPILKIFYEAVLERRIPELIKNKKEKTLICISIPFAGTYVPGLFTAGFIKQNYKDSVFICIGGGFVNTELRDIREPALAKYIDAISYDRGYGSYKQLLESSPAPLFKMRLFTGDKIIEPQWQNDELEKYEAEVTPRVIPDYDDIDFSRYLRVCDDRNSMHRIWTDGSWIKAYLAHGCYWHRCAFCDTNLDYVCGYKPVNTEALYDGLLATARKKNIYGIHFVDEAMPPVVLKKFALKNARKGKPLYFWGNIRFEKAFTKDFAAFLSYCGLGGVSAGLEVATGTGLKYINKGTDIRSIIRACAAFKEAGILVHAYMIYGFWYDTPQTIIDSMETLRQFFAAGLLDSSFWHKFVLTRNSTVYTEWKEGRQPDLKPLDPGHGNNLHFKGEETYDKFGLPLETALNAWMHGDRLETNVQKWFNFPIPKPTVSRNYVNQQIEEYEKENNARAESLNQKNAERLYWLGNNPVRTKNEYCWIYLMEEQSAPAGFFEELLPFLLELSPEAPEPDRSAVLKKITATPAILSKLKKLMGRGLVLLDF